MRRILLTISLLVIISPFILAQDYWEHIYTNDTSKIWTIKAAKDGTLYYGGTGGLFISDDNGYTWECKNTPNIFLGVYVIEFDIDSNLFVGATNRLYKYYIDNDEWELLIEGEHTYAFTCILVDSSEIYAGRISTLYRKKDSVWEELETIPEHVGMNDIVKDTNGILYTCSTNYGGGGAVTMSTDSAETWSVIGLEDSYIRDLAFDSQNILYASTLGHHHFGTAGVFRYNSEAEQWDTVRYNNRVECMLFTSEDSLYIGQYTSGGTPTGAYMSTDLGESWINISSGLQGVLPNVEDLTMGSDYHLYAIVQDVNSIYRSTTIVGQYEIMVAENILVETYPNPFSTSTTIEYELNQPETVKITFYNSFGRVVDIIEQYQQQGLQKAVWMPENLPEGIYHFRLEAGEQIAIGKVVSMK